MKVKINYDNNLSKNQIETITTLKYQIQEQINLIPCLRKLNSDFEIQNIKFDEDSNPIFDVKIDNDFIKKGITGEYDTSYYKLSDWQEVGELGYSIGYLLEEIVKDKLNTEISFIFKGDENCIGIKKGDFISTGLHNGYTCLAATYDFGMNILNESFFKIDKDIVYVDGRIYNFDTLPAFKKFVQELETDDFYKILNCNDVIKERLWNTLNIEVDIFWENYQDSIINCEYNVFQDLINNLYDKSIIENNEKNAFKKIQNRSYQEIIDAKKFVIMSYKGKDFYVIPAVWGESDTLMFQPKTTEFEKQEIFQSFKNLKENILIEAITQVENDFGKNNFKDLNFNKLPEENANEIYINLCKYKIKELKNEYPNANETQLKNFIANIGINIRKLKEITKPDEFENIMSGKDTNYDINVNNKKLENNNVAVKISNSVKIKEPGDI